MEQTTGTHPETASHEPGARSYFFVWAALVVFTALTVAVASLNLRKIAIIICLAIASFKSLLVVLYFMHLRDENRLAIKLIIPIAICAVAIFIGITFSDVFTR